MATASADTEEPDTDASVDRKEDIQRERFRIRFSYLKSDEEVVKNCFVDKLPTHITSIDKTDKKCFITAYGEYKLTFEQDFQTTQPASIEQDAYKTWFSYKPTTEMMAWMEVLREKRLYPDSAKSGKDVCFYSVRVIGGSMTSPVTFVRHWELEENMSVSFEFETSKITIKKDLMDLFDLQRFILEISFDSIHETIIVQKTDTVDIMMITLKSNPKIFDNFGKIVRRFTAEDTGFDDIGCLSSYCIEFDGQNRRSEVDHILSSLICFGFRVAYIKLQTKTPEPKIEILLPDDFELEYAWQCVNSIGFKVTDHLSPDVKRCIEHYSRIDTRLMTKGFYTLAIELMEKPFFHFKDEFNSVIRKIRTTKSAENELPPHYSLVARMIFTPTRSLYLPKEPVFQNRLLREYGEDFFIKVVFRDDDFQKINSAQSSALSNILDKMKSFFKNGFLIKNRHYEFLGCSNSQLREHSFWFFHPRGDISSERIRHLSGTFLHEKCIASYVSRFGLCFSSTKKTVDVDRSFVSYIDDVKNEKYCFTDGVGCISTKLAKKVANALNLCSVPSAFQIRFGGCKGVIAQNPTLGNDVEALVIRESMKKFESKSNNLEVLEVTRPERLHLNRQVITLLSGLGIPDHVFLNLQEKMLIDMADMLLYDEMALPVLLESSVRMDFSLIADKGLSFVDEPFFRSLLQAIYHHKILNLMKRTRKQIPLDKGRIMMGTTDETKTLKSGEVFIRYSQQTTTPGKNAFTYEGPVVVTKNPCFHEGDVRVFIATNVPELSHMIDCIVFPQKGTRPHPDEMSGSDLDGDMYFVCWDQDLCKFQNQTPMDFPKAEKKQLTREVNSDDVIDFLANYIRYDKLGLIANAHLVHADSNENGIFSEECHSLARLHSDAVDFPKTGKIPKIDDKLRPKSYPDFMMKSDKQIYASTKIIGKLFRQCRSLLRTQNKLELKFEVNNDFILPFLDARILEDAKLQRDKYTKTINEVLELYGIRNENEAITGLVQNIRSVKGCLKDEKFQVGQIIKAKMCLIRKRTREIFFEEFGGELNVFKADERVLQKASAWYTVTYMYMDEIDPRRPILSFPWTVADVLVVLKERFSREPRLNRLEAYLNKYYIFLHTKRNDRRKFLQSMLTYVKTVIGNTLSPNTEDIIDLDFCGLLKNQSTLNVATTKSQHESISKALRKKGMMKMNNRNQDLCYCVTSKESAYVRFIVDARIINLSKAVKRYLMERPMLLKPVQFLLDLLQNIFTIDSDRYNFSDIIAVMIVFFLRLNNVIFRELFSSNPGDHKLVKCILGVLKYFILDFRSWDLNKYDHLKDGLDALSITFVVMSEISDRFMILYHKIALDVNSNPFLEARKSYGGTRSLQNFEYGEELNRVFILPLSVWNIVKSAKNYVKFQLSKQTGAEIIFQETQTGLNRIQAWGNDTELGNVEEIISNISKTSSELNLNTESGHLIVENAYCVFFQGGSEESELSFERYRGIHHAAHSTREKYVPKLMIVSTDKSYKNFERKLVQQWNILRTKYNAVFHGDLYFSISFGTLYVMNIKRDSRLNVSELNNLFTTIDTRKKEAWSAPKAFGSKTKEVSYSFSFHPVVFSKSDKIRKVLERLGFTYNNDDKKTKISVRFKDPNFTMHDYDDNCELCWVRYSDIKWFTATILPVTLHKSTQIMNIRCKLQSCRELDGKIVNKKKIKCLETATNGYQLLLPIAVSYAKEKLVESYTLTNWFRGYKVMVEIATVTELNDVAGNLVRNSAPRLEILVLPEIPNIDTSEEELKSYTRHIWSWTLDFAANIENM